MTLAQEITLNRYSLKKHSTRNGFIICKAHDGWVLVAEEVAKEYFGITVTGRE